MMSRTLFLMVAAFAALSLILAACGDDDDDANGGETEVTQPADTNGDEATEPADGEAEGDAVAAGEEIYQAECAQCHSTDGSEGIGPTWQGIWGREETLESGETVTVDEEYVRNSIENPDEQIVEGFSSGVMPQFDLSDEEIDQIIAFMQTL